MGQDDFAIDFQTSAPNQVITEPTGVTISEVAMSSGSISYGSFGTTFGGIPHAGSSGSWMVETDPLEAKNFFFTITAEPGFTFDLTDVSSLVRSTGAGPSDMALIVDSDVIESIPTPDESTPILSVSGTGLTSYTDLTSITIKIAGYDGGSRTSTGGGAARIGQIEGTLVVNAPAAPLLSASPDELEGFNYIENSGPSTPQTFVLSGSNLDGSDVTIDVPANFEASFDETGGYDEELILDSFDGEDTTVYVRLVEGLAAGPYAGTLFVSGGGADTVEVALEGSVVEEFQIPYENSFRTEDDIEVAELQGFILTDVFHETGDGGYTRISNSGIIESPQIDFTEFDGLEVLVDLRTFGGNTGQVLSLQASSDDGDNYNTIESWSVPGSYEQFSAVVDLRTGLNEEEGRLRFLITDGSNQVRFRDLEIVEFMFPGVPDPEFSVAPDTYFEDQTVFISNIGDYDSSAEIYFTTNGDDPTSSDELYDDTDGILLEDGNGPITLKAIAIDGSEESGITTGEYTFPVNVSDIEELRNQSTGTTIYRVDNEATFIGGTSFRNTKFFQDDSGFGIQIDDDPGIIVTNYDIGDNVAELVGTLGVFQGQLQLTPLQDPEGPVSTGNEITPIIRELNELTSDDQSRLITVEQIEFEDGDGTNTFGGGGFETNITDPSITGFESKFRNVFGDSDITASVIPGFTVNVTGVIQERNDGLKLGPRNLDDFESFTQPLTVQTSNITDVSCFGAEDGAIEIEVEGGLQPYSFSWEGPDGFIASDSNITNLAAGTYNLTVTDSEDSTATLTAFVNDVVPISATVEVFDVSCFGEEDGSIEFDNPNEPFSSLEYSIDGGNTWSSDPLFEDLAADTFDLRVREADPPNCELVLDSAAVINEPDDFTATFGYYDFSNEIQEIFEGDTVCGFGEAFWVNLIETDGDLPIEVDYIVNNGQDTFTITFNEEGQDGNVFILLPLLPEVTEITFVSVTDANGCASQELSGFTFHLSTLNAEAAIFSVPDSVSIENGAQFDLYFSLDISGCDAVQAIFLEMEFDSDFVEVVDIEAIDWNTGETQTITDNINNADGNFSFEAEQFQPPNPSDTTFEFVKVTFEAKQTTGDSVTMLEYMPPGLGGGTEVWGFDNIPLAPLVNIPIHIFGCDEFDIVMSSEPACFGESDGLAEVESVSAGTAPYNYLWNTGDTTQAIDSVAAGLYTVTVTDDEGCTGTAEVTVNERDSIEITTTVVDAECFGEDGSITMGATGGNGGFFNFTVNDDNVGGSSGTITINRPAGTYEIVATNSGTGCQGTAEVVINQPDSIQFNEQITDPLCWGEAGTIEFNPSGGTGSISVTLADTAVSSPLELPDGSYTLEATDDEGCENSLDFTITEPDQFSIITILQQPDCPGELWDFLFLVSGGTGQLTFTLNGDTIDASIQSGGAAGDSLKLPPDDYELFVIDENECTFLVNQFSMVDAPPIPFPVEIFDAPCIGEEGLIANEAEPGNVVFFVDGDSIGSELMFSAEAGEYLVMVQDEDGCTRDSLMTIGEPDEVVVEVLSVEEPVCFGGEGTITFTASGGNSNFFDFTVNDEDAGEGSGNINFNVEAGQITIEAEDSQGCTGDTTFIMNQPDSIQFNEQITDPLCRGETGTIEFNPSGGTGNISVTLADTAVSSPLELQDGTYTLVATDHEGCVDSLDFNLTQPDPFEHYTLVFDPDCPGGLWDYIFFAKGGTGELTFQLNGDTIDAPLQDGDFVGDSIQLPAGGYTLTATDENGCSTIIHGFTRDELPPIPFPVEVFDAPCFGEDGLIANEPEPGNVVFYVDGDSIGSELMFEAEAGQYLVTVEDEDGCTRDSLMTIGEPDEIDLQLSVTQPTCETLDGMVTFDPIGGTGTIEVSIDEEEVTSPLTLQPGTYDLVYSDDNDCEDTVTVVIIEPELVELSVDSVIDATCFGENGTIGFSATGGNEPLTFTLDGAEVTSPVEPPAGTYTLIASDGVCGDTANVTISEPDEVVVEVLSVEEPDCFGEEGTITFRASGGNTSFYDFTVNDENAGSNSGNVSFNVEAGEITVEAVEFLGCSGDTTFVMDQPDSLELNLTVTNPDCEGELGQVTFDPQGGIGDLTVLLNDTTVTSPLDLPVGSYSFTVIDDNGCETTDSIDIEVLDPFSVMGEATDAECHGENGLLTFSGQGGLGDINFFLDNQEVESPLEVPAGSYTIFGQASGSGCNDSITLVVNQPDSIVLDVETSDAICFGEDGSISISATGGTDGFIFEVEEEYVGSSSVTVNRPAGEYLVSAIDGNQCVVDTVITIEQPDSLILEVDVTDPICFGEDGILELSAIGGTAPYYFFIGESPIDSLVMLPAGNYLIQLEDENGCFDSGDVDIGEPDPVESSFAVNEEQVEDGDTLHFTNIDAVQFTLDSLLSGVAPVEVKYSIIDGTDTTDLTSPSLVTGSEIFNQTFDAGFYEILITGLEDDDGCEASPLPYFALYLDVKDAEFDLSGSVELFGDCPGRSVEVLFYDAGTSDLLNSQSGVLDSAGNFEVSGIIAGQYDVFVDVGGYLLRGLAEVAVNETNLPNLDFGRLTAGDVTGDNNVGQDDLDALLEAYNTLATDADYNENADFDCNGKVDIDDLTKLIEKFGETGDQPGNL